MGNFKISIELIVGLAFALISAYYWSEIGSDFTGSAKTPPHEVPTLYRFTYRLFPFADITITVVGMVLFYTGLKRLRE